MRVISLKKKTYIFLSVILHNNVVIYKYTYIHIFINILTFMDYTRHIYVNIMNTKIIVSKNGL